MVAVFQGSLLTAGPPGVDVEAPVERIQLDDRSWVEVVRGFYGGGDDLCADLIASVPWVQGRRWMCDREIDAPRLSFWDRSSVSALHPALAELHAALDARYEVRLGGAGLNYYRDGRDSVAWHSDDERELGRRPVIASLSLGATRVFQMKHVERRDLKRVDISLKTGSLLVMAGDCQACWRHQIPKRRPYDKIAGRINLTFRRVQPA